MISHIDKTIERLVRSAVPLPEAEYDVSFDIPTKEWTNKISSTKPTVNIYLYDLSENRELRENEWKVEHNYDGTATKKRPPVRLDIFYMLTAWSPAQSEAVLDEHHLLSKVLTVLFKYSKIPREHFQGDLAKMELEYDILLTIEYPRIFKEQGAGLFWSAVEQHWKPFIPLVVTIPLDLQEQIRGRIVTTKIIKYDDAVPFESPIAESIQIGGMVTDQAKKPNPINGADIELFDSEEIKIARVSTTADGFFSFTNLTKGKYTLNITASGFKNKSITIDEVLSSKAGDLIIKLNS